MNLNIISGPTQRTGGAKDAIGVVVIGRNEGARLRRCLGSISEVVDRAVYVDSGSTDGSVVMAQSLGLAIVELDQSIAFTAGRARNEGFQKLLSLQPELTYVFFVDGDCEIVRGWLERSGQFLDQHPDVAIVWGRRREKYPEKSIYNMLCDIEWDIPVGEAKICGGDALARVDAFKQVQGYRSDLICGEEPELCVRLRRIGWQIWHVDDEMTLHDAAIYRFDQWWRRMLRSGYAFAQGAALHGAPPERHWVSESRRAWIWGLCMPVAVLALSLLAGPWAAFLLLAYPLQVVRLALCGRRSSRENWWRAGSLVLGKFPEMLGQIKYVLDRYRGTQAQLIEYK